MVALPVLFLLFNLGLVIYLAVLATRFVRMVERIADRPSQQ